MALSRGQGLSKHDSIEERLMKEGVLGKDGPRFRSFILCPGLRAQSLSASHLCLLNSCAWSNFFFGGGRGSSNAGVDQLSLSLVSLTWSGILGRSFGYIKEQDTIPEQIKQARSPSESLSDSARITPRVSLAKMQRENPALWTGG